MRRAASPAHGCRRRRLSAGVVLVSVAAVLRGASAGAASAARAAPPASVTPSCSARGTGWCIARRFPGTVAQGELGFRFGEPLDVDGDGRADVAAGARFKLQQTSQSGTAVVWSGRTGGVIRGWDGEWQDGLFGHWVMPIADISGDGLADVIIAAPHAPVGGRMHGIVVARSPKTGKEIWKHEETESENLGWDLTLAGDQDGDGQPDLFVGAPAEDDGRVYLLSGKSGAVLQTYAAPVHSGSFGWWVARLDDLDGDGRADLAVGAPYAQDADGARVGEVWVLSAVTGKVLQHWRGTDRRGAFGSVLAPVADLDGDGKRDLAIAAPATEDQTRSLPGELHVYSTASGKKLRSWSGTQPGELYGRMVVATSDLDGDGVDDVAIGAPWHRREIADRVGRIELRSGRTGDLLAELVGDGPDCWFGWHVRPAPDPGGQGRPALLVDSLRHPVGGELGVGVLDLYVLRRAANQGTTTRRTRRSAIR